MSEFLRRCASFIFIASLVACGHKSNNAGTTGGGGAGALVVTA